MNTVIGVCLFLICLSVAGGFGFFTLGLVNVAGGLSIAAYICLVPAVLFGALAAKSLMWAFKR